MIQPPKPKELRYLPGVGILKAQALEKLGVHTTDDLLDYFPREWVFAPRRSFISDMEIDQHVVITGRIKNVDYQPWRGGVLYVTIADESADCELIWYHGGFLRQQLRSGVMISAFGTVKWHKGKKTLINPKFITTQNQSDPDPFTGPVYPASAKITSDSIKYAIRQIPATTIDKLKPELFDGEIGHRADIVQRGTAYRQLHAPANREELKQAKKRIKFDELFMMQLGLAIRRQQRRGGRAKAMNEWSVGHYDAVICQYFPFELTDDQNAVIREIVTDMRSSTPMNRLLQGDVDSGKTAVAMYAAMLAVLNGTQVAIMAPTQILAEQHYSTFQKFLADSNITCRLAVGKTHRACTVDIDVIIGTTALLNKNVKFHKLGLIIVDEQHRFGVQQRVQLRKGKSPHCLVMSATPIPRTIALTVFGDLDVSTIHGRLPGRTKVVTRWVTENNRENAYEIIRRKLAAGEQAFVVCPRIQGDGTKSVEQSYEEFCSNFAEFNVGIMHSRLPQAAQDETIHRFQAGKIHMLVSTTIIEVGVDISNTTIMVIEDANYFGLSQLHQLRGRVGRGLGRAYCFLFSDTTDETAVERLETMVATDDGFQIAEQDLRLRGPGQIFSTKQWGLPDLKLASLIDDYKLLLLAREIAIEMIADDPTLEHHKAIKTELKRKYGDKLQLSDVG